MYNRNMKVAIFGGSFDPVHKEHISFVKAAIEALALDKVLIMPSSVAPHKSGGAVLSGKARAELLRVAFSDVAQAEVCEYEIERQGVSYTYLTAQWFREKFPSDERFFLVGKDMLEDFFSWKNPQEILSCVTLVACGRGDGVTDELRNCFMQTFGVPFIEVDFVGEKVSSTLIRVELAFGKQPQGLPEAVYHKILERGYYEEAAVLPALALEKPERQEHSFRVAKMATERARSLRIPERKALLAAALHDCGKYVPLSSPLLKSFVPPEGVPSPVMHQFTGAYLAEQYYGISDEEILNAIRFHTSGRENATALDKLIFLADMLEEARDFEGVERLRALFWKDLDECFYESLKEQVEFLKNSGKPVYELTEKAYEWEKQATPRKI